MSSLIPAVWRLWESLGSSILYFSSSKPKSNQPRDYSGNPYKPPIPVPTSSANDYAGCFHPASFNCANSNIKLLLHLADHTVYQRGINSLELSECSPHALYGTVVLVVLKPIHISSIQVCLKGFKFETVLELSSIKTGANSYADGQKKIHYKKLLDDCSIWKFNDLNFQIGIYTFPFQFLIDPNLPPSISSNYINIHYNIEALINYQTSYSSQVSKVKSIINIVRCLSDISNNILNDPILASGNWRNLMIYQFQLQNKIAFQNCLYNALILIHNIDDSLISFHVHAVSIYLIQSCQFDKVEYNGLRPISNVPSHLSKHFEYNKFLLLKKLVSLKDFEILPNGSFQYICNFKIPSCQTPFDESFKNFKKCIYPTINNSNNDGFTTFHNLKICLEVSESKQPRHLPKKRTWSDSSIGKSSDLDDISPSQSTSFPQSTIIPGYSTYHQRKNSGSKFKKTELSFTVPIFLLTSQSCQSSKNPPLYSHISSDDSFTKIHDDLNSLIPKNQFKSKYNNGIIPPNYSNQP